MRKKLEKDFGSSEEKSETENTQVSPSLSSPTNETTNMTLNDESTPLSPPNVGTVPRKDATLDSLNSDNGS